MLIRSAFFFKYHFAIYKCFFGILCAPGTTIRLLNINSDFFCKIIYSIYHVTAQPYHHRWYYRVLACFFSLALLHQQNSFLEWKKMYDGKFSFVQILMLRKMLWNYNSIINVQIVCIDIDKTSFYLCKEFSYQKLRFSSVIFISTSLAHSIYFFTHSRNSVLSFHSLPDAGYIARLQK